MGFRLNTGDHEVHKPKMERLRVVIVNMGLKNGW